MLERLFETYHGVALIVYIIVILFVVFAFVIETLETEDENER